MGEFDSFAESYEQALAKGLSVSGEESSFFRRGRLAWLQTCLHALGESPRSCLDFGCGSGSTSPELVKLFQANPVIAVDTCAAQIRVAQRSHAHPNVTFAVTSEYQPAGCLDLAYANGVFHHIPPAERAEALAYIRNCLRPKGLFAFWENNPWNPGTRYVMSRVPFDRDATMISAPAARRLLRAAGFTVLSTRYCFIFPRLLKGLRPLEPWLARFPLGAQYQVLCRKAAG